MASTKKRKRRAVVALPETEKMLRWRVEDQLKVYRRMIAYLVPENRAALKRSKRLVPRPVELEERIQALSAYWVEQRALAQLNPDFFKWPSTKAWLGSGQFEVTHIEPEGVLSLLGYTVNQNENLSDAERRKLLDYVFSTNLPPIPALSKSNDWGEPETPLRLKKMANCLAAFTRNAKRREDRNLDVAIGRWESDLKYLKQEYYTGTFGFVWPATTVLL